MKRIALIFGTRPEAIKMCTLYTTLKECKEFDVKLIITGQHKEMLNQVLEIFGVIPDFNLELLLPGQSLAEFASRCLIKLDHIFKKIEPDLILVHGDTNTTSSSTLAAYYNQIPVAHVEAGLRTGNIYSPWPEEGNRRVVGSLANLHFAPTENARENLLNENIPEENIHVTGNTVIDALLSVSEKIEHGEIDQENIKFTKKIDYNKKIILVTGHRRENIGQGFESICDAISDISKRDDIEVIYPLHMNPAVRSVVERKLANKHNIHLIEPQDYLAFIYLLKRSHIVMTDSGGIQEEAPSLGKPVLVMRDTTERPEAVNAGTVRLVGTDRKKILNQLNLLLDDPSEYNLMAKAVNPYGDGHSSKYIKNILISYLK